MSTLQCQENSLNYSAIKHVYILYILIQTENTWVESESKCLKIKDIPSCTSVQENSSAARPYCCQSHKAF